MSDSKNSDNTLIYQFAEQGDLTKCKELRSRGADINMAIMGACDGIESIRYLIDHNVEGALSIDELKKKGKFIQDVWNWALLSGACMLFGIQQRKSENNEKRNE